MPNFINCILCGRIASLNSANYCKSCDKLAWNIYNSGKKGASEMPLVIATKDEEIGTYELNFAYDAILLSFIKTFVPASDRSWNAVSKRWTIDEKHWFALKPAFIANKYRIDERVKAVVNEKKYNPDDFFYNSTPTPATETKESISAKLETLLQVSISTLPFDELKKAYRRKALELHPDRNPENAAKMSELNSLWTIYNK